MQDDELLNYLEALIKVSEHPEIKAVRQYDGAAKGVRVDFTNGSAGYLALATRTRDGGRQ